MSWWGHGSLGAVAGVLSEGWGYGERSCRYARQVVHLRRASRRSFCCQSAGRGQMCTARCTWSSRTVM